MKKYYFISYHETKGEGNQESEYFQNSVINIHPLKWQMKKHFNDHGLGTTFSIVLLSYQEISKQEFDEFNNWEKEL